MKITSIKTYLIEPRWLFLRVETDDGIVGWGEPVVEGRAHTVAAAVDEMSDYLIGADPTRIEDHWQVLTKGGFYRGGPILSSAVAGIDQALWDIRGKSLGVPVHELLGGAVRDTMRIYCWIGGDEPTEVGEEAARQVEAGLTAVKMNATGRMRPLETTAQIRAAVDRVAAVREVMGPDRDVAVDFHGRISPAVARVLCRELEPLQPMFVEEPVVPELSADIGKICASTTIPIATGERLFSRWDFRDVLPQGVAVVQPDLSHAGGISECRRIAAFAEAYGVALAPHCPLGPVALAASLQVDFASPNALIQETSLGIHYNQGSDLLDYLADPAVFAFADGYVQRPTAPGLGVEIDEAAVAKAAETGHRWRSPIWRHEDGGFAEW
ncbi:MULTISPECIES: galactonate dehydratase [Prauserella salsuginis group]|uniref:Galactonate dehydratase n=2 Tax=Prauserella salsuginis group TaxID=2893672 RepID=A0A839XRA9_9PSEU|nr:MULTISPECIES: galactonate dehydratase [Prauserella salsuginis group]MBB3662496.1 galactonate dehydratase [Prauserella sediminis]MCR3720205.1 galactonate dehydratase [Prauserella flava]MCR3734086.1 galactonate dehydratase [Prauserella salsuginis]